MIRLLIIFLLIFSGCSSNNKSSLPVNNSKKLIKKTGSNNQIISKNFNSNLKKVLNKKSDKKEKREFKNNLGRQEVGNINYIISSFKFKKIKNFSLIEPNLMKAIYYYKLAIDFHNNSRSAQRYSDLLISY